MSNYFALSQIFIERYSDYGVRWAVTLETGSSVLSGVITGAGTHFMIPRQGQVELKWVFDTLQIADNRAPIDLDEAPVVGKVCFDDYARWALSYEDLGQEAWLNQWMIEASEQAAPDIRHALLSHPAVRRQFPDLAKVRFQGAADQVPEQ